MITTPNCYKCGSSIHFSSEWITKTSKKMIPLDNINGKLTPHKCKTKHENCDCLECIKKTALSEYELNLLKKYKKTGLDGLL